MRIIKHRALGTKGWKHTEDKGWFYGTNNIKDCLYQKTTQVGNLFWFEKHIQGNYFDEDTRGQFVGLKDIKNIDIYEGDIVEIGKNVYIISIDLPKGLFFKCVENLSLRCCDLYYNEFEDDIEIKIIGNIHQNKDMIK